MTSTCSIANFAALVVLGAIGLAVTGTVHIAALKESLFKIENDIQENRSFISWKIFGFKSKLSSLAANLASCQVTSIGMLLQTCHKDKIKNLPCARNMINAALIQNSKKMHGFLRAGN